VQQKKEDFEEGLKEILKAEEPGRSGAPSPPAPNFSMREKQRPPHSPRSRRPAFPRALEICIRIAAALLAFIMLLLFALRTANR